MRPEKEIGGQRSFIEEARRRQIIAAAVEVLADHGFGGTSLARIAERAGISKGVISYHFDGKDELLREVVTQLFVAGAEFMAPRLAEQDTATDTLRVFIATNLEFLKAERRFLAAMIEVAVNLRNADGTPAFLPSDGEDAMVAPVAEILREGQRSGEFGDFDPVVMARLIRDSIDGVAGHTARDADFDVDAHADQLVRIYLAAVQPTPPPSA
ncbi:TetR family transcriptional regulator [Tsukamurella pulmonis]|uniref:DNA-binding transcriptional regulator, AcrR family n=1 Tax=Tsukamurella pulmonis TaxID=47312 RepID=A0A1H1B727_9ACTN|nr:TetR/AcrR family transcriptional regulator [Tsukamurella pulmonis]KXO94228.1 TetR family transcriptional regulator [Tsukamurella pulmonis]KXP12001.1 TetR family transcriptional regulator [Tsukamurella pulmonis]RDH12751.1 TetR/AcrR family transcriptional regulator [Tsukamurella pulmonis]SDQ47755.1 DNA-binding transcriptional regulator, AcrR family [Tsukamurella pulmonis]SUP25535.1 Fatty acid metabolism regulator protein [Tsukamurella pulmonis]